MKKLIVAILIGLTMVMTSCSNLANQPTQMTEQEKALIAQGYVKVDRSVVENKIEDFVAKSTYLNKQGGTSRNMVSIGSDYTKINQDQQTVLNSLRNKEDGIYIDYSGYFPTKYLQILNKEYYVYAEYVWTGNYKCGIKMWINMLGSWWYYEYNI